MKFKLITEDIIFHDAKRGEDGKLISSDGSVLSVRPSKLFGKNRNNNTIYDANDIDGIDIIDPGWERTEVQAPDSEGQEGDSLENKKSASTETSNNGKSSKAEGESDSDSNSKGNQSDSSDNTSETDKEDINSESSVPNKQSNNNSAGKSAGGKKSSKTTTALQAMQDILNDIDDLSDELAESCKEDLDNSSQKDSKKESIKREIDKDLSKIRSNSANAIGSLAGGNSDSMTSAASNIEKAAMDICNKQSEMNNNGESSEKSENLKKQLESKLEDLKDIINQIMEKIAELDPFHQTIYIDNTTGKEYIKVNGKYIPY